MKTLSELKKILSEHYHLGELTSAIWSNRGYVNVSYKIEMLRDGTKSRYLLRHYENERSEKKIRFEHALLNELIKRKFDLSPHPIKTKKGTTYAKIKGFLKDKKRSSYIAVFSHLPGEDKYCWNTPLCTVEELTDAARVLALYHNTISGWKSERNKERPPCIIDQVRMIARKWQKYARRGGKTYFDTYFLEHLDSLLEKVKRSLSMQKKSVFDALPHLAVHGDFHPGNLKFQGGKVTGVFDFDWANMDARCFDVGLALNYFCTSWEEATDGTLLMDRVQLFLETYQRASEEMDGLGPLDQIELKCLSNMVLMSNLYVLQWLIEDFYKTKPDPEEYVAYLRHGVRLMRWLERNWDALERSILKHDRSSVFKFRVLKVPTLTKPRTMGRSET
jgi:homoserine kinase type II